MSKLTAQDYTNILKYYKINVKGKSKRQKQKLANNILANKLCRCIKKVKGANKKTRKIAICNSSVIKKKGLRIKRFTCKKKNKIVGLKK